MPVTKCKKCKGRVNTKLSKCPSCGAEMPKESRAAAFIGLIFVVVIAIAIIKDDDKNHSTSSSSSLSLLSAPFQRPFQYVGMTVTDAAKLTGSKPNSVSNIVVDSDRAHMLLEAEGNLISYVDIELKQTAPCSQNRSFDSEEILSALSINPSELEFARKQTHFHTYYDHKRKLKVGVSCQYDGASISVGFSSRYYGM